MPKPMQKDELENSAQAPDETANNLKKIYELSQLATIKRLKEMFPDKKPEEE